MINFSGHIHHMAHLCLTGPVAGMIKEENTGILVLTAVFVGFPVAIDALETATEVFGVKEIKD